MSEHDEDQGKWVGAFLLGVLVGALLMLGIGGGLWTVQARQARMMEERARAAEMMAREEAERARVMAEEAAVRAREAEKKAHEILKNTNGPEKPPATKADKPR